VGGVFKNIGRRRELAPIEPLDRDTLFSRIGGPSPQIEIVTERRGDDGCPRHDGPRSTQPRSWRQIFGASR
jgi:hypothetical protein